MTTAFRERLLADLTEYERAYAAMWRRFWHRLYTEPCARCGRFGQGRIMAHECFEEGGSG